MCTIIHKHSWNYPQIAETDITVYKKGKSYHDDMSIFVPMYYGKGFNYVADQLCSTDMMLIDNNCVSDREEDNYKHTISEEDRLYIGQGFHSYKTMKRAALTKLNGLYGEFIIPEGSEYYINGADNIVSNQIIFKKFICV